MTGRGAIVKCFVLLLLTVIVGHVLCDNNTEKSSSTSILLETFENPMHHWYELNDPVMGGRSVGTFTIENGIGVFDGEVVDVPFLQAPGFITAESRDLVNYPDVSSCQALKLTLKSTVDYDGYRVSFGRAHAPNGKFFAYGYKADIPMSSTAGIDSSNHEFQDVIIPFEKFTDYWDDATGDPIGTCQDDTIYCPDVNTLENMRTISIWAEGVAGKVHLDIKSIAATECTDVGEDS